LEFSLQVVPCRKHAKAWTPATLADKTKDLDSGQHLVVARRQNVNAGNLGFLVQLLGAKLGHLFDALKNLQEPR